MILIANLFPPFWHRKVLGFYLPLVLLYLACSSGTFPRKPSINGSKSTDNAQVGPGMSSRKHGALDCVASISRLFTGSLRYVMHVPGTAALGSKLLIVGVLHL